MSGVESQEELRKRAIKRVRAKQNFWRLATLFVIIWAILIAVWALSGGGYFWPAWAILGMGIALAFTAWGTFGKGDDVSQAKVEAEMRKMDGGTGT